MIENQKLFTNEYDEEYSTGTFKFILLNPSALLGRKMRNLIINAKIISTQYFYLLLASMCFLYEFFHNGHRLLD